MSGDRIRKEPRTKEAVGLGELVVRGKFFDDPGRCDGTPPADAGGSHFCFATLCDLGVFASKNNSHAAWPRWDLRDDSAAD